MTKPKQNNLKQTLMASIIAATIGACGGNKVLISQSEIDRASQSGNLQALYQKASNLVEQNKGSEETVLLQSKIAKLLVAQEGKRVDDFLSQLSNSNNSITRQQLIELLNSIENMKAWSSTDYERYKLKIDSAMGNINNKILEISEKANDPDTDKITKVKLLEQAAVLAGENQPETENYNTIYEQTLSQFLYLGNDSLKKGLFSTAQDAAKSALKLDAGNVKFESMLSQAQAGLFEKDFRYALENGKPESAYQSLLLVADEPIFLQLKKSMASSIGLLANYFAASAAKATSSGDLLLAYESFNKARDIQLKTIGRVEGFIQEKKFLDAIIKKSQLASNKEGNKQALLRIVNEFDPQFPSLSSEYLKSTELIKNRALTKLSVAEFKEIQTNDSISASVGRRIGSKLEKILFNMLGNEIQIVTQAMVSAQENPFQGLSLFIDGEILQAIIETQVNKGKRSKRVKTGVNRVETEAYKEWSERKRGEAPNQYNETPIMEDVVLEVSHIRKQAIAEVAFRIVEPASGNILLTDNFVQEGEFKGESINEYQKGDFSQSYQPANLPSDIKIMDELATELAKQLGEKLGGYLKNSEEIFYQKYMDAKAQNNQVAAIEYLSNAIVIAENKKLDKSIWLTELKTLALAFN